MANPVESFLRGFDAVDRLETRRQLRDERAEQQSRLRTLWLRADQQYERDELNLYRKNSLIKFNAQSRALMDEISAEGINIEQRALAGGVPEDAASQARTNYVDSFFTNNGVEDGKLVGFNKFANEVVKRMIEVDPSFGEHIAFSTGVDPYDGKLVSKTNPVSGAVIVPPELDPAGIGGVSTIYNTENGQQPGTKLRTSEPTDLVDIRPFGLSEITNIFGEGVLANDVAIARQIRDSAGVKPTGSPSADLDKARQGTEQQQQEEQVLSAQAQANVDADERAQGTRGAGLEERKERAGQAGDQEILDSVTPEFEAGYDFTAFDAVKDSGIPVASGLAIAADSVVDAVGTALGALSYTGKQSKNAFVDISYGASNLVTSMTGSKQEPLSRENTAKNKVEQRKAERAAERNFARNQAAETMEDVPTPRSTYDPNKVGSDPKAAANAALQAPLLTEQGVVSAANATLQVQGKPRFYDVVNAVSLMKMNIITPQQMMNFANTGQYNAAAKAKLQLVTDDKSGITTVFSDGVPTGQYRTGIGETPEGSELAKVSSQHAYLNLLQDDTAGTFEDNPRRQEQFIRAADATYSLLGLPGATERDLRIRSIPDNRRLLTKGAELIEDYDQDWTQKFDMWYGDPFIPMNSANLAVASKLVGMGVSGSEEGTYALNSYVMTLKPGSGLDDKQFIAKVTELEGAVQKAVGTKGEITLRIGKNKSVTINTDGSKREIRHEIVEALISARQ